MGVPAAGMSISKKFNTSISIDDFDTMELNLVCSSNESFSHGSWGT